jgi:G3E family GTPase
MDLAAEEAIERSEADIRAINSSVQIIRTTHAQVDLRHILHR